MKNSLIGSLLVAIFLAGCDSSGGICCKGDGEEEQREILLAPTAVLDNRTEDVYGYPALVLSGARSHDNDENNQSIQRWDWNITSYNSDGQIVTTDPDCTKVVNNSVEVNVTYQNCQQAEYTFIRLTVTDDEGETDTAERNISVLY